MINSKNYFDVIAKIDIEKLPTLMQELHVFVEETSSFGSNWKPYEDEADIKEVIDSYFERLDKHLAKESGRKESKLTDKSEAKSEPDKDETEDHVLPDPNEAYGAAIEYFAKLVKAGETLTSLKEGKISVKNNKLAAYIDGDMIYVTEVKNVPVGYKYPLKDLYEDIVKEQDEHIDALRTPRPPKQKRGPKPQEREGEPQEKRPQGRPSTAEKVERISDEVRFIKRFVLMHDKIKTPDQVRAYINGLQKAITEKRIRKSSNHAGLIEYIQDAVITFYNKQKGPQTVSVASVKLDELKEAATSQKILLSTGYLKRYIGIQGRTMTKEKAERLHNLIEKALDNEQITEKDPYYNRIKRALVSLMQFIKSARPNATLEMHPAVLNGINESLDGLDLGDLGN